MYFLLSAAPVATERKPKPSLAYWHVGDEESH